ncbi:MAG: hypothetical protein QNJ16_08700 [Rhodobacter sp.]|nr:hypothetical protein [Rhodobacter sp.]
MTSHERWDVALRILFAVIGGLFTLFVFLLAQHQRTIADETAALAAEERKLAQAREIDLRERTSLLGSDALIQAFIGADITSACHAFRVLSGMSQAASDEGLEVLPQQVAQILAARRNIGTDCTLEAETSLGAASFDLAELRVEEAASIGTPQPAADSQDNWFPVVLSLKISTPNSLARAQAFADSVDDRLSRTGDSEVPKARIWETQISRSYAVTLGGPASREVADRLVKLAREQGVADDAFAQQNKGWVDVERQADPVTEVPLAGFDIFVHLPADRDSPERRRFLLAGLAALGGNVRGFDTQVNRFGIGVDHLAGNPQSETAARAVSDFLAGDPASGTPQPRPLKTLGSPSTAATTLGLWLDG